MPAPSPLTYAGLGGPQPLLLYRAQDAQAPVVLVVPAMGLRAEYYRALAEGLVERGLQVALLDHPGHGQSPLRARRGVDWGYHALLGHLSAARAAVSQALPGAPLYWLGHSIGGQVALMAAGQEPVAGVILVASGAPYWRAWPGRARWRVRLGTWACARIAGLLGYFPGERVGFGGLEAATLVQQWAQVATTGRYVFPDLDGDAWLGRVQAPVVAVAVEGDDLAPEAAIRHTLQKLGPTTVREVRWPGPHGDNCHNRWPRNPGFVAALVAEVCRGG